MAGFTVTLTLGDLATRQDAESAAQDLGPLVDSLSLSCSRTTQVLETERSFQVYGVCMVAGEPFLRAVEAVDPAAAEAIVAAEASDDFDPRIAYVNDLGALS